MRRPRAGGGDRRRGRRLTEIARFYNSPGFSDEQTICFLAEDLERGDRAAHGIEEEYIVVERVALASVEDLDGGRRARGREDDHRACCSARSFLKSRATGLGPPLG